MSTQLDRIEAEIAQIKVVLGSLLDALADEPDVDEDTLHIMTLEGEVVGGERDTTQTL